MSFKVDFSRRVSSPTQACESLLLFYFSNDLCFCFIQCLCWHSAAEERGVWTAQASSARWGNWHSWNWLSNHSSLFNTVACWTWARDTHRHQVNAPSCFSWTFVTGLIVPGESAEELPGTQEHTQNIYYLYYYYCVSKRYNLQLIGLSGLYLCWQPTVADTAKCQNSF